MYFFMVYKDLQVTSYHTVTVLEGLGDSATQLELVVLMDVPNGLFGILGFVLHCEDFISVG